MRETEKSFIIEGVIEHNDGHNFTPEEANALWDDFIDFVEARNLSFGGTCGINFTYFMNETNGNTDEENV